MENASKALIIAGAILLAILIIGLGMYIYQQASGVMGQTNLDSQQVTAYNSEFLQYEGTNSGSNTRALYNLIVSHNRTYSDDPSQQIGVISGDTAVAPATTKEAVTAAVTLPVITGAYGITTPDAGGTVSAASTGLMVGNTYSVSFAYSKQGYVTFCYIKKVS